MLLAASYICFGKQTVSCVKSDESELGDCSSEESCREWHVSIRMLRVQGKTFMVVAA